MSLEKGAKFIVETLKKHNYEAYFVGGCVRDRLLGIHSSDIDIATSAPSKVIQTLFKKTIPVGIKFGIIVVVEQGHNFEVATFRKDKDYIDGRRPEGIEQATLQEDVKRRDFTINGLYFDPIEEKFYDFVGGKKDLNDKLIKAIGDPIKRFEEDHLRMIRACRYGAYLNFNIEASTQEAIIKMAPICHEGVSIERIVQELEKMHIKGCLSQGLLLMHKLQLLKPLFPLLNTACDATINERCQKIKKIKKETPLIFPFLILFDLKTKPELENFCKKFKLSYEALKMGLSAVEFKDYKTLSNIAIAKLFSLPYFKHLEHFEKACINDEKEFVNFIHKKIHALKPVTEMLINNDMIVKATDLEQLNMPKGPLYKQRLDQAMSYFADHPTFTKEQVLDYLRSLL